MPQINNSTFRICKRDTPMLRHYNQLRHSV